MPERRLIDARGGDREYVVARAICEECQERIRLWRTEFDDHPTVETWKHLDGVVICQVITIAKPAEDTIEFIRSEP